MLLLSWSKGCFAAGANLTKTHHSENVQESERFWLRPFEVPRFPFSHTPHTHTKHTLGTSSLLGFHILQSNKHTNKPTNFSYRSSKLSYEPDRNHQHLTSILADQNNEDCMRTRIQSWLLYSENHHLSFQLRFQILPLMLSIINSR